MKSNTVMCGEYPVRVLFNEDKTLAWINLYDLCKALGREEMVANKEAVKLCPSAIQIPFRKKGREMWGISPYDVYKLMRPMRKENPIAARNCATVEAWLNSLLEEAAIQAAQPTLPAQQEVVFSYQDHPISFRAANGRVMINATQMAKGFNVLPSEILRKADFIRIRQHLVDTGVSESLDSQIFTTRGRNNGATWVEESLATEFARQLSPEFSQWCNSKISELMTRGYATIDSRTDTAVPTTENLPIPQNLDEAKNLILAQRQEIRQQQQELASNRFKIDFYDNLIEGRDFFTATWLAQELSTTPRMLHQFLAEKGICKFEKNQWVAFNPYRAWQIDIPYYWNNQRTGKYIPAGSRKRWSQAGREQIIELWKEQPPRLPELPEPGKRRRKENPYADMTEGVDYFMPSQLARELGISTARLNKFLESSGICRFENKQWAALDDYQQWQIDVPYYWTNPKTGKRWAFGSRKRWTLAGMKQIAERWKNQPQEQPIKAAKQSKPCRQKQTPCGSPADGTDCYTPSQLAKELGISVIQMNKFLEESRICEFVKKEWAVIEPYSDWQTDIPYRWTNPKTGKSWVFGKRKRWTKLGREKIHELWYRKISRQEARNTNE
mgnify:CR=1 FL=1